MLMVKLRKVSKTSSSLGDGEDDLAKRKWKTCDEKEITRGMLTNSAWGLSTIRRNSSEFQAWKH